MPEADVSARVCRRSGPAALLTVIAFCIVLSNLGACEVKPTVRTIAGDVRVDREWIVLQPQPPLEVRERVQEITIGVAGAASWDMQLDQGVFVRPDGTLVKIEVELEADDGRRFLLDELSVGRALGFSYLPDDISSSQSRLPADTRFTAVRIRSDKPLDAGPVAWVCYTNF